jgi:uncharacterized membrane protein
LFVLGTVICWGLYVPTLHHGQAGFGAQKGTFRAFMLVGVSYFIMSGATLLYLTMMKPEPMVMHKEGVTWSLIAGILGALGALGILFALKSGGKPSTVAPLVFAGAPIVATIVGMMWDKPTSPPKPLFFVGIVLAAAGAAMVLRFKPH